MQQNVESVLTLEGDEVSWKQAQQQATQAVDQNKNALDGNSKSALNARQAIISATDAVVKFANDQFQLHGNLHKASNAIQDQINWLEKHAGKSKIAAQEIKALRHEENLIKAQIRSQILISGQGKWAVVGTGPFAGKPTDLPGGLHGLVVPGVDRGVDSQLIMARPGELVVPTEMVQAGAVDHLRGKIPGFLAGGVVGSYGGPVPGETSWLAGNLHATFSAMADNLAQSMSTALTGGDTGAHSALAAKAQAFARAMLGSYGWGAAQFPPLLSLWNRASGWNPYAVNPASGAAGIPQALGHGHVFGLGDYIAQVLWGLGYIKSTYGSPAAAWGHELSAGWYDMGGWAPPGASLLLNGTGKPEPILTDAQWQALSSAVAGGDGASGVTEYHAHFDGLTNAAIQGQVRHAFAAMEMQQTMLQRPARRR